jgi:hypothetical protein
MRVLLLLNLDHAGEVLQLERTAEIIQVMHGERCVLGSELDVVVVLGIADQFYEGGPAGQDVRADRRLPGVQLLAQAVRTHELLPPDKLVLIASFVRSGHRRNLRDTACFQRRVPKHHA